MHRPRSRTARHKTRPTGRLALLMALAGGGALVAGQLGPYRSATGSALEVSQAAMLILRTAWVMVRRMADSSPPGHVAGITPSC
jgi:hypothetical protein